MVVMLLLLLLPQSIFVIGDYIAFGIRFPFFRLQMMLVGAPGMGNVTQPGTLVYPITIVRELQYIPRGLVGNALGKTAIATYLWFAGLLVLILAAILVLAWQYFEREDLARYPGLLVILTGVLFLLSAMAQYGPLLYGVAGYSVPIGVPILWYFGYEFVQAAKGTGN